MKFNKINLTIASAVIFLTSATSFAANPTQEIRQTASNYFAYPYPEKPLPKLTKAPKGYEPFHIEHYGRHGSRWHIGDWVYPQPIKLLEPAERAGKLTPRGIEILAQLRATEKASHGRDGELTPLGARQHKGIAERMFDSYPTVFPDSAEITARSTQVMRCAHSMVAFRDGLIEKNPALVIPIESAKRWMSHLCWWTPEAAEWNSDRGPWKQTYDNFEKKNIKPSKLVKRLFTSTEGLPLSPEELMWGLYWVAVDMQNMETKVDFFDVFKPEELYALWRVNNLSFYIHNSSFPMSEGLITANARNLLDNIILTADEYVAEQKAGATLRFGHDGNITPLAALMKLDGYCGEESNPNKVEEAWANFKVTPMASNLQIVFFRPLNGEGDVLVKFMMSEHDVELPIQAVAPYFYTWTDARSFLKAQADAATAVIVRASQK